MVLAVADLEVEATVMRVCRYIQVSRMYVVHFFAATESASPVTIARIGWNFACKELSRPPSTTPTFHVLCTIQRGVASFLLHSLSAGFTSVITAAVHLVLIRSPTR